MKISHFVSGGAGNGWDNSLDREVWSHDICLRTDGTIEFGEGEDTSHLNVLLLEFFLELKAALLSTLGNPNWEKKLALSLSGDGVAIQRERRAIRIMWRDRVLSEMSWNNFLDEFATMERDLGSAMREAFPKLSASAEFQLLFGETG